MNAAVLGLKLLIGGDSPRPPPSSPLPLPLSLQAPVPAATAEGATTLPSLLPTRTHTLASTHPAAHPATHPYSHALILPYTLPPDVVETVADIDTACRAAVDILNDLLTFEKLER